MDDSAKGSSPSKHVQPLPRVIQKYEVRRKKLLGITFLCIYKKRPQNKKNVHNRILM